MAVPKFLRTFIDTGKTIVTDKNKKTVSGIPGSGHERVKENKITKRDEGLGGIFGSRPFLTRDRFRKQLKKTAGKIPGGGTYTQKERIAIEEKLFPKEKFGQYITPYEISHRIKNLKHQIFVSRDVNKKMETRKQVKFLEKLRRKKKDDK
jgi:hypothetical protein